MADMKPTLETLPETKDLAALIRNVATLHKEGHTSAELAKALNSLLTAYRPSIARP